jgi:drug/metabolite transporter (DMT)-like permease
MNINKRFILSFVAPFMILISAVGVIFRGNSRKIFYLPIGVMGVVLISEKGISRQLDRKNILKKIKSYKKAK